MASADDTQVSGIQIQARDVVMRAGGDIIAGNKTTIKNFYGSAAKKIEKAPYKFLSYYDIGDQDIFFGRDAAINDLAGKIPRHRTVIINGQSGSGKTSLINAGLIPRLVDNDYLYVYFRDYLNPLQQCRDFFRASSDFGVEDAGKLSLLQILKRLREKQEKLVVVFDQFERFLSNVSAKHRREFFEQLGECINSDLTAAQLNLVISLRDDFYGKLLIEADQVIPSFGSESHYHNLRPLSRDEARIAIIEPLKKVPEKIGFETKFVDEVLLPHLIGQASGEQEIKPTHLQIVCNQLYDKTLEKISDGEPFAINQEFYDTLGGTEGILRDYLDNVVKRVAKNDRVKIGVVRSILKTMINSDGTRRFLTIDSIRKDVPPLATENLEELAEKLDQQRVVEVRPETPLRYSLSHEFMVEKVASWYDVREMEKRKAEEALDSTLTAFEQHGTILDVTQLDLVTTWLNVDALSQEKQTLISTSKNRHYWQRAIRLGLILMTVIGAFGAGIGWWLSTTSYAKYVKEQNEVQKKQGEINTLNSLASFRAANDLLNSGKPLSASRMLLQSSEQDPSNSKALERLISLIAQRENWRTSPMLSPNILKMRELVFSDSVSQAVPTDDMRFVAVILNNGQGYICDWGGKKQKLEGSCEPDDAFGFEEFDGRLIFHSWREEFVAWDVADGRRLSIPTGTSEELDDGDDTDEDVITTFRMTSPNGESTVELVRDEGNFQAVILPKEDLSLESEKKWRFERNGKEFDPFGEYKEEEVSTIAFSPSSRKLRLTINGGVVFGAVVDEVDVQTESSNAGYSQIETRPTYKVISTEKRVALYARLPRGLRKTRAATVDDWSKSDWCRIGSQRSLDGSRSVTSVSFQNGTWKLVGKSDEDLKFPRYSWPVSRRAEEWDERQNEEFTPTQILLDRGAVLSGDGRTIAAFATDRPVAVWRVGDMTPIEFGEASDEGEGAFSEDEIRNFVDAIGLDFSGNRLLVRRGTGFELFSINKLERVASWDSQLLKIIGITENSQFLVSINRGLLSVLQFENGDIQRRIGKSIQVDGQGTQYATYDSIRGQLAYVRFGEMRVFDLESGYPRSDPLKFPTSYESVINPPWFSNNGRVVNLRYKYSGGSRSEVLSWPIRFSTEENRELLFDLAKTCLPYDQDPSSLDWSSLDNTPVVAERKKTLFKQYPDMDSASRNLVNELLKESLP